MRCQGAGLCYLFVAMIFLSLVGGCGNSVTASPLSSPASEQPESSSPAPTNRALLPEFNGQQLSRHSGSTEVQPQVAGSLFDSDLPHQGITISGDAAVFDGNLSFAMYHLKPSPPEDVLSICPHFDSPPPPARVWIGLPDYKSNSWLWCSLNDNSGVVSFAHSHAYMAGDGTITFALAIWNTAVRITQLTITTSSPLSSESEDALTGTSQAADPVAVAHLVGTGPNGPIDVPVFDSGSCVDFAKRVNDALGVPYYSMTKGIAPSDGRTYLSGGAVYWWYLPDSIVRDAQHGTKYANDGTSRVPPSSGDVLIQDATDKQPGGPAGHVLVPYQVFLDANPPHLVAYQQNVFYSGKQIVSVTVNIQKNSDGTYQLLPPPGGVGNYKAKFLGWIHYRNFTPPGSQPAKPPTGLRSKPLPSLIRLLWDHFLGKQGSSLEDSAQFVLLRDGEAQAVLDSNQTSFDDVVFTNGPYDYSLCVLSGTSIGPAATISAEPQFATPTWIDASHATLADGVELTCDTVTRASSYRWYRDFGSESLATTNLTKFTDTGVTDGKAHAYQVTVVNGDGSESARSGVAFGWNDLRPIAVMHLSVDSGPATLHVQVDPGPSTDTDASVGLETYQYDYDGDGVVDQIMGIGTPVLHDFDIPGTYFLKLTVTDGDPAHQSASVVREVTVLPPSSYTVSGTVIEDDSGSPLPGVTITLSGYGTQVSGADGGYSFSGVLAKPEYDLSATLSPWHFDPAPYHISVQSDRSGLTFRASSAPAIQFTGSPMAGLSPLSVTLTCAGTIDPDGGPITKYEWDWNGDGQYDFDSGTENTVDHTFSTSTTVGVRVTDDDGQTSIASLGISVDSGSWHLYTVIAPQNIKTNVRYVSLADINGRPAIAWSYFASYQDLYYDRADNADGTSWSKSPVAVSTNGSVGNFESLAFINGHPAVTHLDDTNHNLLFTRASDDSGSSWTNAPVIVESNMGNICRSSLSVAYDGYPIISYMKYVTDSDCYLRFSRGMNHDGTAFTSPVTVDSGGWIGMYNSILNINGYPGIAYSGASNGVGRLRYKRATQQDGSDWGSSPTLDLTFGAIPQVRLSQVADTPAIAFGINGMGLSFIRAVDPNGGVWPQAGILLDLHGIYDPGIAVSNGLVRIGYQQYDTGKIESCSSTDGTGDNWAAPQEVDGNADAADNQGSSTALINGHIAIAYADENQYAVMYALWY